MMKGLGDEVWHNLSLMAQLMATSRLGFAFLNAIALCGALLGLGAGVLIAFVVYQFSKPKTSNEANLILFCTLGGWLAGLLLTVLMALVAVTCSQAAEACLYPISPATANLFILAIAVVPSLGAVLGALLYWRSLGRHE